MTRLQLYADPQGRLALHESGFSWLAAFLLPVWALQRGLPLVALLSVLYGLGIPMLARGLGWPEEAQALLYLANGLAYGFGANRLHRWLLQRRGCTVTAEEPLTPRQQRPAR